MISFEKGYDACSGICVILCYITGTRLLLTTKNKMSWTWYSICMLSNLFYCYHGIFNAGKTFWIIPGLVVCLFFDNL